jgi:hypothetical protein
LRNFYTNLDHLIIHLFRRDCSSLLYFNCDADSPNKSNYVFKLN